MYTKFGYPMISRIVSELGLYSYTIAEGEDLLMFEFGDYLVRSKKFGVDEGGICTGFAFLDTFNIV